MSLVRQLKDIMSAFPREWDARHCILQMREEKCPNWRQMEWIGWFFQHLCDTKLNQVFLIPGESFRDGSVRFDGAAEGFNFDFKAHALKKGSKKDRTVLNDKQSMDESVAKYGRHGLLLALLDCDYDTTGDFKSWHDSIKGGTSAYVSEGHATGRKSRVRKIKAKVVKFVLITITKDSIQRLPVLKQGKNSNGKPRPVKYGLDISDLHHFSPIEI